MKISINIAGFDNFENLVSPETYRPSVYPKGYEPEKYLVESKALAESTLLDWGVEKSSFSIKLNPNDFEFSSANKYVLARYESKDLNWPIRVLLSLERNSVVDCDFITVDDGLALLFYKLIGERFLDLSSVFSSGSTSAKFRYADLFRKKAVEYNFTFPLPLEPFAIRDSYTKEEVCCVIERLQSYLKQNGVGDRRFNFGDNIKQGMTLNLYRENEFWVVREIEERYRQSVVGYFYSLESAIAVFVGKLINLKAIDTRELNRRAGLE